jgi:hypothetical protein
MPDLAPTKDHEPQFLRRFDRYEDAFEREPSSWMSMSRSRTASTGIR